MTDSVLVSVIIATYHREESFHKALESIINQTYPCLEIIVVDDNANVEWNTRTESIVNQIKQCAPDFLINYIRNERNKGSAESRNTGIRAANGQYITFLDDDDVYFPEKIEKQLEEMLQSNADYGLTDLFLYNQQDKLIDKRIRSYIQQTDQNSLICYHLMYHMTGTDTLMFKTNYLIGIGMFPQIDVGDEFYLMERAILGNGKICYSPHCYVKAYVHDGEEEGLSSGKKKIEGENLLFSEKKKYFDRLDWKSRQFVKMRHYAVISFANLRMKYYFGFVFYGLVSAATSPLGFIKMLKMMK